MNLAPVLPPRGGKSARSAAAVAEAWYLPGVPAAAHPRTGVLLSLASALLAASFLIPYKLAGDAAPRDLVVLAMLTSAALLNTLVTVAHRLRPGAGARPVRSLRLALGVAAVLGVLTTGGNFAVAQALAHIAPGLVSVVQQTQVVFVAVASAVLLGERITARFVAGALVALSGFAVMRMPVGGEEVVATAGILWAVLSALCFGLMHVVTRKVIQGIDPVLVNSLRLWLAVAALACLPGRAAGALALDAEIWALAAAAAFVGPFVSRLCLMYAVRHISASRSSLLTLTAPVFAFGLGFAILGIEPGARELAGGALIVAGIAVPLLERAGSPAR